MAATLSLQIQDLILDQLQLLPGRPATQSIYAYSLVCKGWATAAQRSLLRAPLAVLARRPDAHLNGWHRAETLVRLLEQSKPLASYVIDLTELAAKTGHLFAFRPGKDAYDWALRVLVASVNAQVVETRFGLPGQEKVLAACFLRPALRRLVVISDPGAPVTRKRWSAISAAPARARATSKLESLKLINFDWSLEQMPVQPLKDAKPPALRPTTLAVEGTTLLSHFDFLHLIPAALPNSKTPLLRLYISLKRGFLKRGELDHLLQRIGPSLQAFTFECVDTSFHGPYILDAYPQYGAYRIVHTGAPPALFTSFPNLVELRLVGVWALTVESLASLASSSPLLTTLDLDRSLWIFPGDEEFEDEDEGAPALVPVFAAWPKLRKVNLGTIPVSEHNKLPSDLVRTIRQRDPKFTYRSCVDDGHEQCDGGGCSGCVSDFGVKEWGGYGGAESDEERGLGDY